MEASGWLLLQILTFLDRYDMGPSASICRAHVGVGVGVRWAEGLNMARTLAGHVDTMSC